MKQSILLAMAVLFLSALQSQSINGLIQNKKGVAIEGATIHLLNSQKFTQSNRTGNFSLSGLRPGAHTLVISSIGYSTQTSAITIFPNKTTEFHSLLQEQGTALDEVIVSGEKTDSRLQLTPIAISALNATKLKEFRVWNITDLTALAPNLFIVEHGNSASSNFFNIRGTLGYTNEQAVATYVDGVYQFEFFSAPINFNNIERVEVLRGPQGTLYGRNAFGGVVNIITKKPANKATGFVELDLGNYGQQRYSAGFNLPIIKNKLLFNVAVQRNQRGAIYSNPTLNTESFDGRKSFSASINFRYIPAENWTVDLNGKTESNNDKGAYPWVATDSIARNEPYKAFGSWANTERRQNMNGSLTLRHFGKKVNFSAMTAVIDYRLWYPDRFDLDYSAAKLYSGNGDYNQNQYTQEFRLSSPGTSKNIQWTVGSYFFTERAKSRSQTFYESDFAVIDPQAPYSSITSGLRSNRGAAVFGQITKKLLPSLAFTAGARYDLERKERTEHNETEKDGSIIDVSPLTADHRTFHAFTPKLTVSYTLSDRSLVYLSYAKGFRVGGFNFGATNSNNRTYNPEKSDNYEIGWKNTLADHRLTLNLTAFFLQQKEQQVTTSTNGLDFVTLNVGDMNNIGIEAEMTAIPIKNVQIEWTAALSKAAYQKLSLFDFIIGTTKDYKGNRPIYTPAFSSMSAIQYNLPFELSKQKLTAFIRAEYRYLGDYFYDFQNTESQPAYGLMNARIGLTSRYGEIAFWARNLNNAQYISWGTFGSYLLGSPRMLGISLTGRF
jgi:iron complex outermembrane recepter protein